jgi:hypothetical protein
VNADVVPDVGRPPRRSDYESIVKGLRPLCDGEELMLRTSLLLMRDRAIATKPISCESSWALLDIVDRETSDAAFRSLSLDDLRELRRLCIQCVMTASGFDGLYQPRLPGLEGGEG